jgi:putative endonuclease
MIAMNPESRVKNRRSRSHWSVYLIRCRDRSLYTGITTDVDRRFAEHQRQDGRGARYLRGRGPLRLVFRHSIGSRGRALEIERRIKRLPKSKKERLVRSGDLTTVSSG